MNALSVRVEACFIRLFSASELRRFLATLDDAGGDVSAELPGEGASRAELAHAAAGVLVRRGMLDGAFRHALYRARPRQIALIDALWPRTARAGTMTRRRVAWGAATLSLVVIAAGAPSAIWRDPPVAILSAVFDDEHLSAPRSWQFGLVVPFVVAGRSRGAGTVGSSPGPSALRGSIGAHGPHRRKDPPAGPDIRSPEPTSGRPGCKPPVWLSVNLVPGEVWTPDGQECCDESRIRVRCEIEGVPGQMVVVEPSWDASGRVSIENTDQRRISCAATCR